jgi:hypothetical protein
MREWPWHTNADSSELYAGLGTTEKSFITTDECSNTDSSQEAKKSM